MSSRAKISSLCHPEIIGPYLSASLKIRTYRACAEINLGIGAPYRHYHYHARAFAADIAVLPRWLLAMQSALVAAVRYCRGGE